MSKPRNRTRGERRDRKVYVVRHRTGAISEVSGGQFDLHVRLGNLVLIAKRVAEPTVGLACYLRDADNSLQFVPITEPPPISATVQSIWPAVERQLLLLRGHPIGYEGAWPIAA